MRYFRVTYITERNQQGEFGVSVNCYPSHFPKRSDLLERVKKITGDDHPLIQIIQEMSKSEYNRYFD